VAVLDHPEVESSQLRTAGFLERLAELNRDGAAVEVVARLRGDGDRGKSFKVTQDILQAHPGIDGVFASNDPSALGTRGALEGAGKADAVKVVGFDGQLEAKRAILEGKIHADPIQFPDRIGVETVRAILRHFAGEKVPPQILIPTNLYRKADAEKDPALSR
jgi:ribose transport system substrate-binding protein